MENNALQQIKKENHVDDMHLVVPSVYLESSNPFYSIVTTTVTIDTNPQNKEVYKVGAEKRGSIFVDMYALGKPALERFAAAAGISINSINSYVRPIDDNTFVGHIEAALLTPDGCPRLMTNEKVIDMKIVEKTTYEGKMKSAEYGLSGKEGERISKLFKGDWRSVQYGKEKAQKFFVAPEDMTNYLKAATNEAMIQLWKDAPQKAWTGAWLRLIRSALNLRSTYTEEELSKPFVITKLNFKPDYSDPTVRRMALEKGFASVGLMFGQGNRPPIPAHFTDLSKQPDSVPAASESMTGQAEVKQDVPEKMPESNPQKHICADCHSEIVVSKADVDIEKVCKESIAKYGRELCAKCTKAINEAVQKREGADPKSIYICADCGKPVNVSQHLQKHSTTLLALYEQMDKTYGRHLCNACMKKQKSA